MPLPLTAILIEHEDYWTGWIVELPEVEHTAPTAAAVSAALPALALTALARREPDLLLAIHEPRDRRPPKPRGDSRARHGSLWTRRLLRPRRVTPRLDLCRSIRIQRRSAAQAKRAQRKSPA